jgi:CBS domain-containing protein
MNILFALSPKQDLMYVYDDFTLRQTLEKWEHNRYASIPVLNRKGEYVGTLTEGDILWGIKRLHGLDLEGAEEVPISSFPRRKDYKAVTVNTSMDQLVEAAMNQNFVPVIDDRGIFIGIVRRQAIIRYLYNKGHETVSALPAGRSRERIGGELNPHMGGFRFHSEAAHEGLEERTD